MPKRPKKSGAWKKLRKSYMKGPKRLKMPGKRRAKNYDPLGDLSSLKRVQLTLGENKHIAVLITEEAFERLNVKDGKMYTMRRNRLTRAGKVFEKIFKGADHNSYVMRKRNETTMANGVGRCIVCYGVRLTSPSVVLRIQPTFEEEKHNEVIRLRMDKLFGNPN